MTIRIVDANDDDDDRVLGDGERVRVPMYLTDGLAGHRPGYVQLTDEQVADRHAARQEMIDRATSAWRGSGCDDGDGFIFPLKRDAARAEARAARDTYVKNLCDAWKHPPTCDFAQPDTGSTVQEWHRHQRGDPDGETDLGRAETVEQRLERERGADYERRKVELSNAWRMGGHAPQVAVVGAGPKSMAFERGGK